MEWYGEQDGPEPPSNTVYEGKYDQNGDGTGDDHPEVCDRHQDSQNLEDQKVAIYYLESYCQEQNFLLAIY